MLLMQTILCFFTFSSEFLKKQVGMEGFCHFWCNIDSDFNVNCQSLFKRLIAIYLVVGRFTLFFLLVIDI